MTYIHTVFFFSAYSYSEVDENDSDMEMDDEEDDLLVDGEDILEDEVDEVEQKE